MGFFDNLKQVANSVEKAIPKDTNFDGLSGASKVSVNIGAMPASLDEFKTKDGADLKDANKVIALTILALCAYPVNKEMSIEMLNYLKGPTPLSPYDKQFLADRFSGKDYLAISFLKGATPENNYTPTEPYIVDVYKTSHSEDMIGEGYLQLFVKSGGADNARPIRLRKKPSTGEWFLWEYFVLSGIREPKSSDPWA